MKYIKLFEGNNGKKYWTVKVREPYFEISMKKIGALYCYQEMKTNEMFNKYTYKKKNDKVYITYSPNTNFSEFKWCIFDEYVKGNIESSQFEYQGDVEVTKQDIVQFKMEKLTDKFNI